MNLDGLIEQEVSDLGRKEAALNFSRHVPLIYLFANALAKPIISGQNPVDYYVDQSPLNLTITTVGLFLTTVGGFIKHMNDGKELQLICENEHKDEGKKEMVDSGMYELTRHPCYLAQTLMAAGLTLISPSIDSALVFASYVGLTEKCAKTEEEKNLALFGEKYGLYLNKVRRWPSIKGSLKIFAIASDYLRGED